jgi:hypothetical protein
MRAAVRSGETSASRIESGTRFGDIMTGEGSPMMASRVRSRTLPNHAAVDQSTFFISIPQQQRGLLSPPPPCFAPRVT